MKKIVSEFTEELAANGGSSVTSCFQCGTCTLKCPSAKMMTPLRPGNIMRASQLGLKDEAICDALWQCTTCYTCVEWCPCNVQVVDVITALRNMVVANGDMYENHKKVAQSLIKNGHTVENNDKIRALRKNLGLPENPETVMDDKAAKADFDKVIKLTKFAKLVD
ncbi:CoB--CoM heterodisulfide reductase iron-sulfur subunit C [Candidatus Methanoplasma termitum]|uniref:HdrC1 protein n=1 Tax=Candidatus Methanoplasma termitum TaxID=1577791 RepID=A0A0A7LAL6_9ARCH|nr:4Fe-4S dicluster domain-containing protein [Candidatus Methanoplasma termitum]AIZ56195.1 CoB--CoM heterodisulfide reductase iron-sulfur subunit C [Candidatus Methanoplasma termitum]